MALTALEKWEISVGVKGEVYDLGIEMGRGDLEKCPKGSGFSTWEVLKISKECVCETLK